MTATQTLVQHFVRRQHSITADALHACTHISYTHSAAALTAHSVPRHTPAAVGVVRVLQGVPSTILVDSTVPFSFTQLNEQSVFTEDIKQHYELPAIH